MSGLERQGSSMTKKELKKIIEEADKAYYVEDNPIMSDDEYDRLKIIYMHDYPEEAEEETVPGDIKKEFQSYRHPMPMLSLNKVYDNDSKVENKLSKIIKEFKSSCIQPKIDGLTIIVYPQRDGSYKFVTRGQKGVLGEILPNFISKYNIDGLIEGEFAVRGEAFLTKTNFEKIKELQKLNGETPFTNIRNAAAGILRRLERSPYIDYLSYMVYEIPGSTLSVKEQLDVLKNKTAFNVVPYVHKKDITLEDIRQLYDDYSKGDIPIDGLVIKCFNTRNLRLVFGATNHHPNDAIAWKKSPETYSTTVKDIVWQVGRDKVTPVAILEPVEINNTMISKASLHNLKTFENLSLSKGDTVSICKSRDVMPYIQKVIAHTDNPKFVAPDKCPCCGIKLSVLNGRAGTELICTNEYCTDRLVQNISYLASKDVLNIKGLSDSIAKRLLPLLPDKTETSIFDLRLSDIQKAKGFQTKSALNLFNELVKACNTPVSIPTLFKACCITNIGESVGGRLEEEYRTMDKILEVLNNYNTLVAIPNIGEKTAAILSSVKFRDKLNEILSLIPYKEYEEAAKPLDGTVWVITGKFNDIPRLQIKTLIQESGGQVRKSITQDVTHILFADRELSTNKMEEARKNENIKWISIQQLYNLIK